MIATSSHWPMLRWKPLSKNRKLAAFEPRNLHLLHLWLKTNMGATGFMVCTQQRAEICTGECSHRQTPICSQTVIITRSWTNVGESEVTYYKVTEGKKQQSSQQTRNQWLPTDTLRLATISRPVPWVSRSMVHF